MILESMIAGITAIFVSSLAFANNQIKKQKQWEIDEANRLRQWEIDEDWSYFHWLTGLSRRRAIFAKCNRPASAGRG